MFPTKPEQEKQDQQPQQPQQQQQQWSVHAEFTISHDGINDPTTVPQTHTEQDENGVRMVYTWSSKPPEAEPERRPSYNFQRGNLLFSSTPPKRTYLETPINKMGLNVQDSGYGSGDLSLKSNNPRCRSTCSIVLSTNFEAKPEDGSSECGRSHSLRCQTPTLRAEPRRDAFYGCGDPWCYHVPETDEVSRTHSRRASRASTVNIGETVSMARNLPVLRDACVQTFEMVDKCTSPFFPAEAFEYRDRNLQQKRRSEYNSRRRTEPLFQRAHSPASFTPDSLDSQQVSTT